MKTYHLTWATVGRQPAFPTESARRDVLSAIARVGGRDIVLFAIVDDHVHIVAIVEPERLGRLRASVSRVLGARSAAPIASSRVTPVETRQHAENLVKYSLNQFEHHGLSDDPAVATGSCFPDIVGARRVPGLSLQLSAALPRFRKREAYAVVGIADELQPATDADVRGLGPVRLADLVAQTFAIAPGYVGNTPTVAMARRVAARLAADVGIRPCDIALPLGITPIAAARLVKRVVDEESIRAVRLRIALEFAASVRPAKPLVVSESDASAYGVAD